MKKANRLSNEIELTAKRHVEPLRIEIKTIMRRFTTQYSKKGKVPSDKFFKKHTNNLSMIIARTYMNAFRQFADRVYFELTNTVLKQLSPELEEEMKTFIEEFALAKATLISETTKERLLSIIDDAIGLGYSTQEIVSRIRQETNITSENRARLIALTETHSAAMYASLMATRGIAGELGSDIYKTWNAVGDSRTRAHHANVHGQKVNTSDPFLVDGEELQYPGDPKASGHNVINCRCVMTYSLK